jgi:pyridoxine 5-phosphate synthase
MSRLRLGLNIDHVATLRQARGGSQPDPLEAARIAEAVGVDGITVHLRKDRRHIQDHDVVALRKFVRRLNLEMANHEEIIAIALDLLPDEVCMVPENRQELTTEGGLDVAGLQTNLAPTVSRLSEAGILVSMFIEPDIRQLDAAKAVGAPLVELHTGAYANAPDGETSAMRLEQIRAAAEYGHSIGLQVNAGHGIDLLNLDGILTVPHLHTLNIGHSIISRAVMIGLRPALEEMLVKLEAYGACE